MRSGRLGTQCAEFFKGIQVKIDPEGGKLNYILSVKDLQDGRINFNGIREEQIVIPKSKGRLALRQDDLIITLRGTSFKAAVFNPEDQYPNGRQYIGRTYPDENLACFRLNWHQPRIIAAYLNSPVGQQYLEMMSTGTRVKSLSLKSLENMRMPMVPLEIQQELSRFLDSADRYLQEIEEEKQTLTSACNAVIGTYMEGY